MTRVVIDTNVVVSSLLTTGSPKEILDLAFNKQFAWYVSDSILAEYESVFNYAHLKITAMAIRNTMAKIRKVAHLVSPMVTISESTDIDDNRFLECAQAAKANYLVTGNLRHFPSTWKYAKVVPPKEFLRLWQMQKPLHRR